MHSSATSPNAATVAQPVAVMRSRVRPPARDEPECRGCSASGSMAFVTVSCRGGTFAPAQPALELVETCVIAVGWRSIAGVLLVGKLRQYIGRISAAAVGKAAQLVEVPAFARQLDQLVDGVVVASCSPSPQAREILIRHADRLPTGLRDAGLQRRRPRQRAQLLRITVTQTQRH